MQPRFFCVFGLAFCAFGAKAQSNGDFSLSYKKEPELAVAKPNHRKGFFSSKKAKPFTLKKQKASHSAQYEFYERVEQAAKDHQKQLKKFSKPQYSNFLYYGHRRLPKRRPPHKIRYCNECGIRH